MAMTCEFEFEAWGPHEGCREFMTEPEATWTCDQPATEVVLYDLPPGSFYPGTVPHEGRNMRALVCDEHRGEFDGTDQFAQNIRRAVVR